MKKLYAFGLGERPLALLLKELLEGEGIACLLRNEELFAALGEIPFLECLPELWVVDDEVYPRVITSYSIHYTKLYEFRDIHICQAITASCAIPVFFRPHQVGGRYYIDGSIGRVAHIDIAIERGAKLIVVVNPRVPSYNFV